VEWSGISPRRRLEHLQAASLRPACACFYRGCRLLVFSVCPIDADGRIAWPQ